MENINLVENSKYILNCLFENKNKISPPYNEITDIVAVNNLTDYEFKGVNFKLIQYQGILKSKKRIKFYGYFTSKKTKKLSNRWLFLNYLYNHSFSLSPFLVPKPIIIFPDINLFLRGEGKGEALFQYIKKNKIRELGEGVPKTAEWLSKLRDLKIENRKAFTAIAVIEKKEFNHYLGVAKKSFFPTTYQKIKRVLGEIQRHSESYSLKDKKARLVHGDFQPTNVIYNKKTKSVTVVDFDWAGVGDPLSDVGNFFLQFDYHAASVLEKRKIINLKKKFLSVYFKKKILNQSAARVNLYQAKFAIQRAIFNAEFTLPPLQQPEYNSTIKCLLKKAEECCENKKNIDLKVYLY